MLGSTGRNSGKTVFACSLVSKFARKREVVAIKVTPIDESRGPCPRGGEGCGVCSSFTGNYCITEETDPKSQKDTSRLLAAAAKKVYWLRALKTHLDEGFEALLERIGPAALSVCESNTLRLTTAPDLFLMLTREGSGQFKESARDVEQHADRIVQFDGEGFDLALDDISVVGGRWALRRRATAVILAGGDSGRMGADKSMLAINGKPMIEHICEQLRPHFTEIIISANDAEKYAFLGLPVVADEVPNRGPLMGIVSALEHASYETVFVTACDIPDIDVDLVGRLLRASVGCDGAVPVAGDSEYEPLFAVYRKSVLAAGREAMGGGKRKAIEIFHRCNIRPVELERAGALGNINTMADYEQYRKVCDDRI